MAKLITKKNIYLLGLFVICLLGIVIVPTYAKFGSSYETTDDVVGLSLNFNLSITNIEEYQQLVIPAGGSESFNVEVTNNTGAIAYYGIWYRMVFPETLSSDVSIGRLSASSVTTSGSIENEGTVTVAIAIINNSTEAIKVDIGVASSDSSTSDIEYLNGKYLINGTVLSLNEVAAGSYVVYAGNNGCVGAACSGQNANYVDDTDMGFCNESDIKFNVNGWRVAYINDGTAYLVSAGAPECFSTSVETTSYTAVKGDELVFNVNSTYSYSDSYTIGDNGEFILGSVVDYSELNVSAETPAYTCGSVDTVCTTLYELYNRVSYDMVETNTYTVSNETIAGPEKVVGTPTHLANLDAQALKYCNATLAYNGLCNSDSAWSFDNNDFQNITGSVLSLDSCYRDLSTNCGLGNELIDNGGMYWFATTFNTTYNNIGLGVLWYPVHGITDDYHYSGTNNQNGLRPVIRLKPTVIVVSGSGTYEDPYVLAT